MGENSFWFSPNGIYLLCFDPWNNVYKTLNLETKVFSHSLYHCIGDNWTYEPNGVLKKIVPIGLGGWIDNGNSVLLYSRHSLWQINLTGRDEAIDLTVESQMDHHQEFEIAEPLINKKDGDSITLAGFNTYSKEEGFYRCVLGRGQSLTCLEKGSWAIRMNMYGGRVPAKAEEANVFLFRKMTADSSGNYYLTADFRNFQTVSNLHPEQNYNWLTTTLIHWTSPDGHPLMGILYRPANFDSKKRYPLLFFYYERLSDNLHVFLKPEAASGDMNIPYMVSRGYLVFTPDIYYRVGYPGRSACDAVVSAARYLARLPFVDTLHMGIQGFSSGGFETNYIATHSSIFAAACAGAAASDLTTRYNQLRDHKINQMFVEFGQYRMGMPPWEAKDRYLDNSIFFNIAHVTTPLLIMHNWNDNAVDVQQGISMFSALRRAGKPAWFLQYPGEGHGLSKERNKLDYTQKMLEFFDYFLKGNPDPSWM